MPPGALGTQLDSVGRKVSWWRAQLKMLIGLAVLAGIIFVFGLSDLWMQFGRTGRIIIWVAQLGVVALVVWWMKRTLRHRFNVMAVAAMMERTFPQLDNHLINYLQFSANPGNDPFKKAYIKQGPPKWSGLDISEMKNRKGHKIATYSLLAAMILLTSPGAFLGKAWGVAVWRVVNPFSSTMPMALTHILDVKPGDTTVAQGSPLVLSCTVQGYEGHRVSVDVDPSDGEQVTYALGKITGKDQQEFIYRIPKVNTKVKYRFKAGDAPFPEWYAIETRPPLGFEEVKLKVKPPDYMGVSVSEHDAGEKNIEVHGGSLLTVEFKANQSVTNALLSKGQEVLAMSPKGSDQEWKGEVVVKDGTPVRFTAISKWGESAEQWLDLRINVDEVPSIKVIAPEGKMMLPPGAMPSITFEVSDTFGLTEIVIEQVSASGAAGAVGDVLQKWSVDGRKTFMESWTDSGWRTRTDSTLAYQIVAKDNCVSDDAGRVGRSPKIIFNSIGMKDLAEKRNEQEEKDTASITKIIEMQRQNLALTEAYQQMVATTKPAEWMAIAKVQDEIRTLMRTLLNSPLNPLGNLTTVGKNLYINEMKEVIPMLESIPRSGGADREERMSKSITLEQKILRQLTLSEVTAAKAKVQRRVSALTAMLEKMIKDQGTVIRLTDVHIQDQSKVLSALIDQQDNVALDLTDFMHACQTESGEVAGIDQNYAKLLLDVGKACESKKIREDAMLASEQLSGDKPQAAKPFEESAQAKLVELQTMLEEVLAEEMLEEQDLLLEAVLEAKERIEKIKEQQLKAIEEMDKVKDQMDKSDKDFDTLADEYEEMMKNTEEAMLQIPTDLNVFMELNVANDIVEDVFQVFEEVKQAPGSEKMKAGDVKERALAKREEFLEGMEEAKGRLDDLEGWLMDHPDDMKITAEAFDKEEMPGAGISLGALQTEAEDIIGDLMKKEDDLSEAADDGAINTSVPDMMANNEIKEGDCASFAAKGKSGNEEPDHKEQDGRSNVGRQGMATGETAAGSGTVGEGDKNIEERRTQDPTQSGQIDLDGEQEDIDTKATGGGKLATGKADGFGMEGGTKRMDSTEEGSGEGLKELMKTADDCEKMYAKASQQNIRAGSLQAAAHHLRQASDAIAKGNISQLKEHRRLAAVELKKAQAELDAARTGAFNMTEKPSLLEDAVEAGAAEAPSEYKDMVADYYKRLNTAL